MYINIKKHVPSLKYPVMSDFILLLHRFFSLPVFCVFSCSWFCEINMPFYFYYFVTKINTWNVLFSIRCFNVYLHFRNNWISKACCYNSSKVSNIHYIMMTIWPPLAPPLPLLLKKQCKKQGLSQAAPLRQSRTAIGIVPLKNGQGDNFSPSKFREKTRNEAHTKIFISVQKLQAETEHGKYILSHL